MAAAAAGLSFRRRGQSLRAFCVRSTEAARLLKLAADQGHQAARVFLGHLIAACPAGSRVRITGLTAAAHLNSRLGTVVHPLKPLAAGRIAVRIDGQTKSVSLSVANVQHANA